MLNRTRFTLAVLLVTAAAPAAALTASAPARPSCGFGVSTGLVSSGASGGIAPQGLGISFALVKGRLRLEPELGVNVTHRNGAAPGLGGTAETRYLSVGGGVLYELARSESSAVYTGGRLGLSFANQDFGWASDGWSIAEGLSAVFGGEYLVSPFVSVGLEARAWLVASQFDVLDRRTLTASTSAVLLVRFYVP